MYSQSGVRSAQWPQKPPFSAHSPVTNSRHGRRSASSGRPSTVSACSAVAVDRRSGTGTSGEGANPPRFEARASSQSPSAAGPPPSKWASRTDNAAAVGVLAGLQAWRQRAMLSRPGSGTPAPS
ncbi:MAG: hypothetical protein COZ06_27315 [Armatimonadetes bacterium CG_4_10_14_3_um_filter_66_18]|nr:MAG: hypothetical protein COS65_23860 [Armatimonadetes bacterium CG06_land_8_20_14_3_00_66_21]PIX38090.1 MAG: hypothetical protein COZ57_31515 [Armatimonadetes bacterium CG_4_8_14_3_um_filter_66_20]PIY41027.1 MAG: hypothetical protein COZ06_27315 [Armatimonadetes bacterium CG_4_10_14_3_um_filter_66_18]PIZ49869.1 MAG: hypothetical protein COY42_03030 [Armatimonadetes bacterium CG_4_10_14_0_8_um_filter_66_14]PJB72177.1 MAG: hypothetical protein CO096_08390 [Armatimonadetes bacterium CG_4_9_14_